MIVTVSVTCERRCRETLVAWALGEERKKRLLAVYGAAAMNDRSSMVTFVKSFGVLKRIIILP